MGIHGNHHFIRANIGVKAKKDIAITAWICKVRTPKGFDEDFISVRGFEG